MTQTEARTATVAASRHPPASQAAFAVPGCPPLWLSQSELTPQVKGPVRRAGTERGRWHGWRDGIGFWHDHRCGRGDRRRATERGIDGPCDLREAMNFQTRRAGNDRHLLLHRLEMAP